MALRKRLFDGGEGDGEEFPRRERKRPTFESVGRKVMQIQLLERLLVPTLRRVVREEFELALLRFIPSARPPVHQIESSRARGWYLHFNTDLAGTLFTGSVITPIEVVLRNADSGEPISDAFFSIKAEIVALDSSFEKDELEDWTKEEFDGKIVSERKGRRPLLAGELVVTLRNGVATFGNVSFTDNSSWTKSRKFRLGVRVVESIRMKERIREARSEAFMVKDHRGECKSLDCSDMISFAVLSLEGCALLVLYKKHDSPGLSDEVWRLKNIGKDGVFRRRLRENGIETVQQFLRSWVIDANLLRTILGNGMSKKAWEETVQHARKCALDNKFYLYYDSELQHGLAFNSIFQAVALTSDFRNLHPLEKLNPHQMMLVDTLKQKAYKNQENIFEFDELLPPGPLTEISPASDPGPSRALPSLDYYTAPEETPALPLYSIHSSNTLDHQFFLDPPLQPASQVNHDLQLSQPLFPNNSLNIVDILQGLHTNFGNSRSARGLTGTSACHDEQLLPWDESLQLSDADIGSSGFLNPSTDLGIQVSGNYKVNKGWRKLGAPLKWGVLVRKHVAAKRTEGLCV
ncbi:hypothetical protein ACLOJK_026382 [Asimina triloba]